MPEVTMILSKEYFARPGSRYENRDAAIIGPELERIIGPKWGEGVPADDEEKTAWTILRAALLPGSKLRPYIELDNLRAATLHRLEQVRSMCQSVWCRVTTSAGVEERPVVITVKPTTPPPPVEEGGYSYRLQPIYRTEDAKYLPRETQENTLEDLVRKILGLKHRIEVLRVQFGSEAVVRYPAVQIIEDGLTQLEMEFAQSRFGHSRPAAPLPEAGISELAEASR